MEEFTVPEVLINDKRNNKIFLSTYVLYLHVFVFVEYFLFFYLFLMQIMCFYHICLIIIILLHRNRYLRSRG